MNGEIFSLYVIFESRRVVPVCLMVWFCEIGVRHLQKCYGRDDSTPLGRNINYSVSCKMNYPEPSKTSPRLFHRPAGDQQHVMLMPIGYSKPKFEHSSSYCESSNIFGIPANCIPLPTRQLFPHLCLYSSFKIRLPIATLPRPSQNLTRLASESATFKILKSISTYLYRNVLRFRSPDQLLYTCNDQKSRYDPENDSQELIYFARHWRVHENHEDDRENYV